MDFLKSIPKGHSSNLRELRLCLFFSCLIKAASNHGYRYFEYAQTAIKYAVEDYFLKPIDEIALN